MSKLRFLDLSGFGASGKGAVIDLLREFNEDYYVPHYSFEFALLRIKDGLINLHQDLIENWSPYRADTSIKRFLKMTKQIAPNPKKYNFLRRFLSPGMRYEYYFNGQFLKLTHAYIEQLSECKYHGLSSYAFQNRTLLTYSIKKMLYKLYPFHPFFAEEIRLSVQDREKFLTCTKNYLDSLFENVRDIKKDARVFVLLNACEPYNPSFSLDFFHSAQQIVVDRDPRDLYLSTCLNERDAKTQGLFSGSQVLEDFVYRYRTLRERSIINTTAPDDRVLLLFFEDLVLKYNETCQKIYDFLGEPISVHINPRKYFKPELSIKGVGMWKTTDKKAEVEYIQHHLKEYCRDY